MKVDDCWRKLIDVVIEECGVKRIGDELVGVLKCFLGGSWI